MLSRLGEELVDVDARLEIEGLRLVDKWHQLKVAINLGRLQHEHASADVEASLATSHEASARALEEAREADQCREVAEECLPGAASGGAQSCLGVNEGGTVR